MESIGKREKWVKYQWTPIPKTGQMREAHSAPESHFKIPPKAALLSSSDLRLQTAGPADMMYFP